MESETVVTAQMLIRKPVNQVFNAFIDPNITTNFWFTKSSGQLKAGETVTWTWEMYNVSAQVFVREIVENELIRLNWGEPSTTIDLIFTETAERHTYVEIKNYNFNLTGNELISEVINSTGGFTTVIDGLKAYMEYGIKLNLIADKFPNSLNK